MVLRGLSESTGMQDRVWQSQWGTHWKNMGKGPERKARRDSQRWIRVPSVAGEGNEDDASTAGGGTYPTLEKPVPLSQMMGASSDMVVERRDAACSEGSVGRGYSRCLSARCAPAGRRSWLYLARPSVTNKAASLRRGLFAHSLLSVHHVLPAAIRQQQPVWAGGPSPGHGIPLCRYVGLVIQDEATSLSVPQTAARKTRSSLENLFGVGSVVTVSCIRRGQNEVRSWFLSSTFLVDNFVVVQFEAR